MTGSTSSLSLQNAITEVCSDGRSKRDLEALRCLDRVLAGVNEGLLAVLGMGLFFDRALLDRCKQATTRDLVKTGSRSLAAIACLAPLR